jgi:hypothetical protein
MASKKKKAAAAAGGAAGAAKAAKDNPYVRTVVEDDQLRDDIQQAYESAKDAFERLSSKKSKNVKGLMTDPKLQNDLKKAVDSIKSAGETLIDAPKASKKKKSGGLGRKLLVLTVAGGLALALSEGLRKKVLDALFGAEEEFEYTSTTAPSPPAPAPAPAG